MYFDDYKKRINAYGNGISESLKNNTISFLTNSFYDAINYKIVNIDNQDIGVRIDNDKDSQNKILYFLPGVKFNKGSMVDFDNDKYYITDFMDDDLYPMCKIQKCNETIKWKDKNDILYEYPCIATKSPLFRFDIDENRYNVNLLEGSLFIYTQANDDIKTLKPDMRFIFGYRQVWRLVGLDYSSYTDINGQGLVQLIVKITTTTNEKDDFENEIADNSDVFFGDNEEHPGTGGGKYW